MFEIIFIAVAVCIIFSRIQKNRGGQSRNGESARTNGAPAPVPVRSAQDSAGMREAKAGGPAGRKTARDAVREAREDGNATTAYLMEKAQEDAREHAREKYEEQRRLRETRGGLPVAQRYLPGDAVPQGRRIVNCGYCGAENLVPMTPGTKYSCYFCRETL